MLTNDWPPFSLRRLTLPDDDWPPVIGIPLELAVEPLPVALGAPELSDEVLLFCWSANKAAELLWAPTVVVAVGFCSLVRDLMFVVVTRLSLAFVPVLFLLWDSNC